MTKAILPIGNGSYLSPNLPVSAQECVNWRVSVPQAPALAEKVLLGVPGSVQTATTGALLANANRGSWKLNDVPYFVNGPQLCRLESDLVTLTHIGTIAGTGRVAMVDNGTQLCIVSPGAPSTGYIFTADPDTLTLITDLDFKTNGEPQGVVFVDSYFVFPTDSKKFIISGINDGLTYSALDFGTAEADPDDIVAALVYKNQLFIAGEHTLEVFQNIGGADFPFQRTGLFVDKGVLAKSTFIKTSNSFMFVGAGENGGAAIWQWQEGDVSKISTDAIDSIIQGHTASDIAGMFAYTYSSGGGHFVCFSLPLTTLVIDEVTGLWHERRSVTDLGVTRSRVNSIVSAYGELLVGDSTDGRIGLYKSGVFNEYGIDIPRSVSLQPLQNNMDAFFIAMLELTVESGVGNDAVPNPQITLEISLDGGKTYRDGKSRFIGKKGEYTKRVIWRRLGRVPRFAVFRFTLSEAVDPAILQLTADIVGGQ